ncbi:sulfatase-like hydrolase/transferase [Flavobacteriaceae bacterium S356]|uniref:Sulfatase-like hydrolase/transferase n=1 Tax=Asprobacillus argus TaxID=3076534 RepID=A0ABU3LCG9_9FLAO|nr:sulfatase-like hydrolase/transferase [Flavobacteriaceae bacterium S356]
MMKLFSSKVLKIFLSQGGLWVPFISLFITYLSFGDFTKRPLAAYFLCVLAIILLNNSIRKKQLFLAFLLIASFLFSIIAFFEAAHWFIFNNEITESTIHIVLETTEGESSEFVATYLSPQLMIMAFLHLLSVIFGFLYTYRNYYVLQLDLNKRVKAYGVIGSIVCMLLIIPLKTHFLPTLALDAFIIYKTNRAQLDKLTITEHGAFKDVVHKATDKNEIYVLIIGESTTSHHMGIYGYYRNTTPLLEKRKPELIIYENVSTPFSNTKLSLGAALSLHHDDLDKKYNSTLIQLFNKAGFTTYWISNQKPIGVYETSTRLISKKSQKSVYTDMSEVMYDEQVLFPFKKALQENPKKKLIVIHLMGTHNMYLKRYPKKFDIFTSTPKTKFNHDLAYRSINHYDNAVLYNDYIVNSIISEVEKLKSKSYVLYFSDHGEDVYETINQACHTQEIGTKPMHDIPFLLWFSKSYTGENPDIILDTARKYSLESLIHTVSNLSNVTFDGYNPDKSIISPLFVERKRTISNGKYYEDVFTEE